LSRRLPTSLSSIALALLLAGCPEEQAPAPAGPAPLQAPPPGAATEPTPPAPGQITESAPAPTTTEPAAPTGTEAPLPDPWAANEPVNPGPPAQPPPPETPPEIAREPERDGAISRFPGIRIYTEERRLEVDGLICMKTGPALEVMGCTRRGKTHESLLLFDCEPEQLYLALVIIGLEATPQVDEFGQPIALDRGDRVVLEVEWKAADAPEGDPSAPPPVDGRVRRRVEDLIWDRVRQGAMPHVGWVFTGSRHVEVPAPPDWKKTMRVFAATYGGNIAATYHDPDAVLDTPLLEGGDDTIYLPYSERLPERGTEVVVHIRPFVEGQDGPPLGGAAPAPGDVAPTDSQTPAGAGGGR
jgi:hypothetical protein